MDVLVRNNVCDNNGTWGIYAGHFSDPDGHMWEVLYFIPRTDGG